MEILAVHEQINTATFEKVKTIAFIEVSNSFLSYIPIRIERRACEIWNWKKKTLLLTYTWPLYSLSNRIRGDKIMFPHATCLCVKTAKKSEHNAEIRELQKHRYHHHYRDNSNRKESGKQFDENSWIIHRRVDFVKITVLTPAQVSSIRQQSQYHQLYNNQVSYIQNRLSVLICMFHQKRKRLNEWTSRNEFVWWPLFLFVSHRICHRIRRFYLLNVETFEKHESFYLSICKITMLPNMCIFFFLTTTTMNKKTRIYC